MYPHQVKARDDKRDFTIYYPVDDNNTVFPLAAETIPPEGSQSVSIDIGIKHFAIRIEKRYANGTISPVFFAKIDFTTYGKVSEGNITTAINPQVLAAVLHFLQTLHPVLVESRLIGIERQLAVNYMGTRMFQHVLTILLIYVPTFKYPCIIMDISPKLKGKMLGAPRGLKYVELKKWGIEKAREILLARGDKDSLQILLDYKGKTKTKGDDLADTILQMEAWHKLVGGITTPL